MESTVTEMISKQPTLTIGDGSPRVIMSPGNIEPSGPSVSEQNSWFDMWSILRYTAIIVILAFLGFNLFTYLGDMTGGLVTALGPTVEDIAKVTGETTKQTTNVAAVGAKGVVDIAAGSIDSGINLLEKGLESNSMSNDKSNAVKKASAKKDVGEGEGEINWDEHEPEADDAGSKTQMNNTGKSGYCYIGEDRGYRSCMKIGAGDSCMSGDIFPSQEICVNPNLRK